MQPLGSPELVAAYQAHVAGSHDYQIRAEILDTAENVIGPAQLVDGQIDIIRDATVHRVARVTLSDPDRALGLDGDSVFAGSAAADRFLRITHTVDVPDFGEVECTPFVGPFVRVNRNGATIDVEAQDKTGRTIYGNKPKTVPRGANAIRAIRVLLEERTGETRFRLPSGVRFRLRRPYSVSWSDESSVWVRVQQIAHAAGVQADYSCDGYFTARPFGTAPLIEFGGDGVPMTVAPASDSDFTTIVNYARVEADKIVAVARADAQHPFSAESLGRNDVPFFLPSLAELSGPGAFPTMPGKQSRPGSRAEWSKYSQEVEDYRDEVRSITSQAKSTAEGLLKNGLNQQVNLTFSAVPVFHLDYGDMIRVTTDEGSALLRFTEASIPLRSGDMSVGLIKQVSRIGRLRK